MTPRPVLIAPHAALRRVCDPVEQFDGALGDLAMELLRAMYLAQGRGLAAPQIGVSQRIFVMDAGWKAGQPSPMVFVNPEIIAQSDQLVSLEEGCLSIPDHPVVVARPAWVDLRWNTLSGALQQARFDGFESACVQHERDHLDGILITDKEAA
ncbi:MAG: peptide deformylase [Pelagimonas sp.]|jgi:peptide deformylase|nr:peptide deformylase [Pelagimonas sp.]